MNVSKLLVDELNLWSWLGFDSKSSSGGRCTVFEQSPGYMKDEFEIDS